MSRYGFRVELLDGSVIDGYAGDSCEGWKKVWFDGQYPNIDVVHSLAPQHMPDIVSMKPIDRLSALANRATAIFNQTGEIKVESAQDIKDLAEKVGISVPDNVKEVLAVASSGAAAGGYLATTSIGATVLAGAGAGSAVPILGTAIGAFVGVVAGILMLGDSGPYFKDDPLDNMRFDYLMVQNETWWADQIYRWLTAHNDRTTVENRLLAGIVDEERKRNLKPLVLSPENVKAIHAAMTKPIAVTPHIQQIAAAMNPKKVIAKSSAAAHALITATIAGDPDAKNAIAQTLAQADAGDPNAIRVADELTEAQKEQVRNFYVHKWLYGSPGGV